MLSVRGHRGKIPPEYGCPSSYQGEWGKKLLEGRKRAGILAKEGAVLPSLVKAT